MTSASATELLPLGTDAFNLFGFSLDSRAGPALEKATLIRVAPEYFRTMGGQVLHGRDFDQHDVDGPEPVAIVSASFARRFGDPAAAVGRYLFASSTFKPRRVVGVAQEMRYHPAFRGEPQVFFLLSSAPSLTIVARVAGRARDKLANIREAVRAVDPAVPVFNVKTMEERLDETLARPKFYATTIVFFGALALLLAVIGVYGVVAYAVVQRTREMGIRLALGMTPRRLRGVVVRQGFITVALGAAAGSWGAIAGGRFLETLVHGAGRGMVPVSMTALAIISTTAAAAMWSATRHISRLDVADVLRADAAD